MMYCKRLCLVLAVFLSSVAQAGSLGVEKDIELLTLDGVAVKENYWIPRSVKSGEHQLVFRYAKRLQDGGREVDYKTPPLLITLNMLSSDDIVVLAPELNTKSQADLYLTNNQFWRVKYKNGTVKTVKFEVLSKETNLPKESIHTLVAEYNKTHQNEFVPAQPEPTPEQTNDLLRSVQLLYIQANETQREEIRTWIMNQ
ncbi:DUF2057 family protein [Rhodanobacter aciditrophus]|uniref:DUF2057 family protein n=1 Tax=Rhodanobacter aciditrophus TaxID=1623218 RepID=A0ABW4B133_9GAMM